MDQEGKDRYWMRIAIEEAKKGRALGEVPVGAVVVFKDEEVSRAHNNPIGLTDPTAHAEIIALRKAAEIKQNYRLSGCGLYVTVEPCVMCLGACIHARIDRLVFGAFDTKTGAVESVLVFPTDKFNHKIEIIGGILADECGKILRDFFKDRR
jgi:tRNA(adenine34) deaminase